MIVLRIDDCQEMWSRYFIRWTNIRKRIQSINFNY